MLSGQREKKGVGIYTADSREGLTTHESPWEVREE
jgi:hypothetical protein